jgi:arginyl-tRNA synthetase
MASDLHSEIHREIATHLAAALAARGIAEPPTLAPPTREGLGDLALPCHPYARVLRQAPQAIAAALAEVAASHPLVARAEAVAGFLNLTFDWTEVGRRTLAWAVADDGALGRSDALAGQTVVVEYSSPNTNKPQHLGHCRNNVLGETVAALLRTQGARVVRTNLINDRGIHICQSMVAYRRFGDGRTPQGEGAKGDHFVGEYYVRFAKALREELERVHPDPAARPAREEFFNSDASSLGSEARELLRRWEAGDPDVVRLWETMNGWCREGFAATYERMGIAFDRIDLESQTYLLGKAQVEAGLATSVFSRRPDGSVVFDLGRIGLSGEKVLLRADGTSLYVTQDIGTALQRADALRFDRMTYVVGNEQDHHFQVLFGVLATLRPELAGRLFHLSYGMVELPEGRMKSREGKVVDADDLMDALHEASAEQTRQRSPELDAAEVARRAEAVGLAGLKFFLLKFSPGTTFVFNPDESIRVEGETGPYCQYAYARASSILRKLAERGGASAAPDHAALTLDVERALLKAMLVFPRGVRAAADLLQPNILARTTFELAQAFNGFCNRPDANVLRAEPALQAARAELVAGARRMLAAGLELMGITRLEEM